MSPAGEGISLFTAVDGLVIVAHPRFFGDVDQVEQLDLSRPGALPGRWIATGGGPVLSADGRLAYEVPYWHNDSTIDMIVRDSLDAPERRVFSQPDASDIRGATPVWGPHDLLVLTAGTQQHPLILIDPGPRERTLAGTSGMSDALFTPEGELSYQIGSRLVLRSLAGRVLSTLPLGGWQMRCWTPDSKLIVVTASPRRPGGQLGVLDPITRSIAPVGAYSGGFLYQVVCPNGSG